MEVALHFVAAAAAEPSPPFQMAKTVSSKSHHLFSHESLHSRFFFKA